MNRDLSGRDYVYVWVNGIHTGVRLGGDDRLCCLSWFPIERHVLVKGTASPDDPELKEYWRKREQRKAKNLKPRHRRLAEAQKGKCNQCGTSLFSGEELHKHHVIPRSKRRSDEVKNLRLVHLYCHQQITANGARSDA